MLKDANDEGNNCNSELSAVVGALLDTLNDKDETVQQSAIESIRKISQKKPVVVIHAAVYFWELHRKMTEVHLVALLKMMTDICKDRITSLDDTLATSVADLALAELGSGATSEQASELIVALSTTQCSQAIGALIIKFQPNVIPHHTIIRAIGMIAMKNSSGMLPFIKVTLSVLVPILPDMHNDEPLKLASTFTLGKISDAISDCLTSTEIISQAGQLNKDMFFDELSSAFEVFTYSWLRTSKSLNLTNSILTSLASILPLLPKAYDEKLIVKLTPVLLNFCKKSSVRLAASRMLSLILNAASAEDVKELVRPNLEQIHQVLSDIVSVAPFEATRDALLTHYEVLQCFRAVVVLYPEEGLDRILQQLKSQNLVQRSRALVVLRHLINTLPAEAIFSLQDDAALQRIALSLQDSLLQGDVCCTRQVIGAIVALAARPSLPLLPSQRSSFIKFMVLHCGSKQSEEADACDEALHLLSSTVEGAETWLWPCLIRALLDQTYAASVVSILRALTPLAAKIIRSDKSEKDFQSIKVLARCLELLEDERNRLAVVTFLRKLKSEWDSKLAELSKFLERQSSTLIWEERIVEFVEETVHAEGDAWALELADELVAKRMTPSLSILIAAVASNVSHARLLIELARTHSVNTTGHGPVAGEYARAVGICAAKPHLLDLVLSIMEESCKVEDARKQPVKLLGLVKDAKAAASNEAAKAGLLRTYAEIARKADAAALFPALEKQILPWIIRQLADCKEYSAKEAGLVALEQAGEAVHPRRLANSQGCRARGHGLATLLGLFQSASSGYRPLQLYPLILRAVISLVRVPPELTSEEKKVLLETTMDKVIAASSEIAAAGVVKVVEALSIISSETVSDSADTLALLVDILLPWMQSKSAAERRSTLLVLRTTLRSYHDSLKYTYPGGKLEPGKLLGRFLAWSADPEPSLRPLVVDCVSLALNIGARHRHSDSDLHLADLSESKQTIVSEDSKLLYEGVKSLSIAACERVASGEVASLAEGLVEGLLCRGEGGIASGIALSELFRIRGFDIPRANLYLIDSIIGQMRQMDNASCRKGAANAIRSLSAHYAQEIVEHLLHQPLPLDSGTKECWRELGKSEEIGSHALETLLARLETGGDCSPLADCCNSLPAPAADSGKRSTAPFSSLAAIVAVGQLLDSSTAESLIDRHLTDLLAVLLKYLAGWLHVDPPMSIISTKFGFVPNRETCKIIPHREVDGVLSKILNIIGNGDQSQMQVQLVVAVDTSAAETEAEEHLVGIVHAVVECLVQSKREDALSNLSRSIGKLVTSTLAAQRVVAVAFYAELIGSKLNCDVIWLDAIINALLEAKADSSPLVRKLATIGLTRVACLQPKQVEEYLDSCLASLLDGLEEPSGVEGSTEVVLESLRGLSILLSAAKTEKPISPRVVLALKPFLEKENCCWEMSLAATSALGAMARGWQSFVLSPDDDATDHLLGCLPCLVIKLEDANVAVAAASREVLYDSASLLQCKSLAHIIHSYFGAADSKPNIENFMRELINCLKIDMPQRAEELRNAVVRGYSRSENPVTRATSALILGLFGEPRAEDVQRMLQLLRDKENFVRARAARGLALCFT
ncbi:maestro heat-like repeat-containing protein family member 1 isoform X2 [Nasonia vitripennis]|uniref:Uncharacterized protein n=1 Tax=Nasonia vitripennis TaxID=7425 RepID=A0A7M7T675_NASVI|nr:maestro heat-like repeat-containing protein family member 1 isoform X2 [Nasonia vitripennis]